MYTNLVLFHIFCIFAILFWKRVPENGMGDLNVSAVKNLREYQIPYVGLRIGVHHFEYQIDSRFFKHFEDSPISDCDVKVRLEFEKGETLFTLSFFIDGTVNVACDTCLEAFDKEIFGDFKCLVKYSDELSKGTNDDDEIIYIARDESHIDIAQLIYEYICLCLPMQLQGCKEPGTDPRCNPEVIKRLKKDIGKDPDEVDPRWAELNKLKFDKN
jgi:uncharacterized metal-binding protein YceD (DUF177 family)